MINLNYSKLRPEVIDNVQNILNLSNYNGRINIIEEPDPTTVFRMQERLAVRNKATEYRDAVSGNWEDNALSKSYFSAENVQILQNGIRAGVYKLSGDKYIVAPANPDTLKIIMRSIYLQYAEHYPTNIVEQVSRLNKLVLDYAVPTTYNEAVGYLKYREDQSTLVQPMNYPSKTDRNYKQLELKPWF
jgi:hypothetical protein